MPAPTITPAPDPPLRSQTPATFTSRAEAFVAWLASAPAEFNAMATYLEALESGTLNPLLAAIAGAGSSADKLAYYSGENTVALANLTAAGRALISQASADAQLTLLGLSAFVKTIIGAADAAALLAAIGGRSATPNVQAVSSTPTITPTFSNDLVKVTGQAAALFLANWSGTPYGGWSLGIRIKDNGTARAITYDTKYRAIGVALPSTTLAGKTLYLGCIYNSDADKIDVVAVAQEA